MIFDLIALPKLLNKLIKCIYRMCPLGLHIPKPSASNTT